MERAAARIRLQAVPYAVRYYELRRVLQQVLLRSTRHMDGSRQPQCLRQKTICCWEQRQFPEPLHRSYRLGRQKEPSGLSRQAIPVEGRIRCTGWLEADRQRSGFTQSKLRK